MSKTYSGFFLKRTENTSKMMMKNWFLKSNLIEIWGTKMML